MTKMAEFHCSKCHYELLTDNYSLIRWLAGQDKRHSQDCDGIFKRWSD